MRIISRKAFNEFARLEQAWPTLAPWLTVPRTEAEYQQLVELLDALIDRVGKDESHPLAGLMDLVGELITHYEDANVPELA